MFYGAVTNRFFGTTGENVESSFTWNNSGTGSYATTAGPDSNSSWLTVFLNETEGVLFLVLLLLEYLVHPGLLCEWPIK